MARTRRIRRGASILVRMAALFSPLAAGAAEDHGHTIVIRDKAFSPTREVVTVGESLTWDHADPASSTPSPPRTAAARPGSWWS